MAKTHGKPPISCWLQSNHTAWNCVQVATIINGQGKTWGFYSIRSLCDPWNLGFCCFRLPPDHSNIYIYSLSFLPWWFATICEHNTNSKPGGWIPKNSGHLMIMISSYHLSRLNKNIQTYVKVQPVTHTSVPILDQPEICRIPTWTVHRRII